MTSKAFLIVALIALTSCGFEPLYGGGGTGALAARNALTGIEIAPIRGAMGQLAENALIDRLAIDPGAPAVYRLEMTVARSVDRFGFRSDESVSRASLKMDGRFRLIDLKTGETVLEDTARSTATFDVVQSDFATLQAERDAERRTLTQLADLVVSRIALHFRRSALAPSAER